MNESEVPGGVPTSRVYAVILAVYPHSFTEIGSELATQVVTANVAEPKVIDEVPVEWK